MAPSTRAAKRIHDYLICDEAETYLETTAEVENEERISNDGEPMAKRRESEKPPRLLDGKYFEISKRENDKVEAICVICRESHKGHIDSTGNFSKHIKRSIPK